MFYRQRVVCAWDKQIICSNYNKIYAIKEDCSLILRPLTYPQHQTLVVSVWRDAASDRC